MRSLTRITAAALAAASILLIQRPACADDKLSKFITSDADAVVSIDIQTIINQPTIQQSLQSPACASIKQKLDAVSMIVGVDPFHDIERFCFFRKVDAGENSAVVALQGRFDEKRLVGLLSLNSEYSTTQSATGTTVHVWRDNKDPNGPKKFGAYLPEGAIIVCNSAARMDEVLSQALTPGTPSNSSAHAIYVKLPSPERPSPTDEGFGKFHINAVAGWSDFTADSNVVHIEVSFDTPEHAADGVRVVEGAAALGKLQDKNAVVKQIASGATVTTAADGKTVVLEARLPVGEIITTLTSQICGSNWAANSGH